MLEPIMLENLINKATKGLKTASLVGSIGLSLVSCDNINLFKNIKNDFNNLFHDYVQVSQKTKINPYFKGDDGFLRINLPYKNQTNYASFEYHKDFIAPETYDIFLSNDNKPMGKKIIRMKLVYSEKNNNSYIAKAFYAPDFLNLSKEDFLKFKKDNKPELGYVVRKTDLSKRNKIDNLKNGIYNTVSKLKFKISKRNHIHEKVFHGEAKKDPSCAWSSGAYVVLNSDGTPSNLCNK